MTTTEADQAVVKLLVPADTRYLRPVRLAVGGIANLVGFDIDAIDDLRMAVDEVCASLIEMGDGSDLEVQVATDVGASIRITASCECGDDDVDRDRYALSRQILSVVSDDYGFDVVAGTATFWLVRAVEVEDRDADAR